MRSKEHTGTYHNTLLCGSINPREIIIQENICISLLQFSTTYGLQNMDTLIPPYFLFIVLEHVFKLIFVTLCHSNQYSNN